MLKDLEKHFWINSESFTNGEGFRSNQIMQA